MHSAASNRRLTPMPWSSAASASEASALVVACKFLKKTVDVKEPAKNSPKRRACMQAQVVKSGIGWCCADLIGCQHRSHLGALSVQSAACLCCECWIIWNELSA